MTSLRHYREKEKFLIRYDHCALRFIFKTDCTNNRLNRWSVRLAPFNLDVEYRPGRKHASAPPASTPQQAEEPSHQRKTEGAIAPLSLTDA